jgi:hypothetical protein
VLDGDGGSDNCPGSFNPGKEDTDFDGIGDLAIRADLDADGVGDRLRQLRFGRTTAFYVEQQTNSDGDAFGDAATTVPPNFNASQIDGGFDGVGDACDNCPTVFDPSQADVDLDLIGDVCGPAPPASRSRSRNRLKPARRAPRLAGEEPEFAERLPSAGRRFVARPARHRFGAATPSSSITRFAGPAQRMRRTTAGR